MAVASGYQGTLEGFVQRDCQLVLSEARMVLDIRKDNLWDLRENEKGRLGVLAVVGPGVGLSGTPVAGMSFKEAVLCEIGISRSRPYSPAYRRADNLHIRKRRRWFGLTPDTYRELGQGLFTLLQHLADARISAWENQTFKVKSPWTYWSRNRRALIERESTMLVPRGVRFSIHREDRLLLADAYEAEYKNPVVLRQQAGLANYVDMRLKPLRRPVKRRVKQFHQLREGRAAIEALNGSTLPRHLKLEALEFIPEVTQRLFRQSLLTALKWDGEPVRQRILADSALPGHKQRVNGTRLRVVRETKKCLVVEIFSSTLH